MRHVFLGLLLFLFHCGFQAVLAGEVTAGLSEDVARIVIDS